ncbi:hypothetical protein F5Y16DRAFT_414344 [Xylariaceae sp. FL0255]|nr:hypothetical protein F5Y16DRAFT_414344 [Xylariaceae sp. FL0255]
MRPRSVDPRPPTRQTILSSVPGLQASPAEVRDWLALYLSYRGMKPLDAKKFVGWRGLELHRASYSDLVDAFRQHCGRLDWEAEVLGLDVYSIVEGSIPPPDRTIFQIYVEEVFGYEFYSSLMQQWTRPNRSFVDRVNSVFCWVGFALIHAVLVLIFAVIVGFLMST